MLSMFVIISISFSLFVVSICAPWVLSDHNKFLSDFVNQELLAFLGITVTISLASGANIFLELNKMEEKIQKSIFKKSKKCVKFSCYFLIALMMFSVFLVTIKPLTPENEICRALINSFGLIVVFSNILIMLDLTMMIFSVERDYDN